jgi:flagellar biosynthetic protein FliR
MITFTSAELHAWIAAFIFPLARVLALVVATPPFYIEGLSTRALLLFGVAITIAIAPALPQALAIDPASGVGLLVLAEQMAIGYAMGFAMRLVFSAVDMAGDMISSQMGLGFATAYDPQSTSQTPVISEFAGMIALLLFLAMNGHLMVLAALMRSFAVLPIGVAAIAGSSWMNLANAGVIVFSFGTLIALPVIVTLLITNIALGILGRVSPQLNLIAIGFPVTILLGFAALYVSMLQLASPLQQMFEYGLDSILGNFGFR